MSDSSEVVYRSIAVFFGATGIVITLFSMPHYFDLATLIMAPQVTCRDLVGNNNHTGKYLTLSGQVADSGSFPVK